MEWFAKFKASLLLLKYQPLTKKSEEELYMIEMRLGDKMAHQPIKGSAAATDMPYVLAILRVREVRRQMQGGL